MSPFAMLVDDSRDSSPPPAPPPPARNDAARDTSNDAAPADSQKADASTPAKNATDSKPLDVEDAKDTPDSPDAKETKGVKTAKITVDGKAVDKKANTGKDEKKADATATVIGGPADTSKPIDTTPQVAVPVVAVPVPVAATTETKPASDADQLAAAAAAAGPAGPKTADAKPAQTKGDAPAKSGPANTTPEAAQAEGGKDVDPTAKTTTEQAPARHGDTEKLLAASLDAAAHPSAKAAEPAAATNANTDAAAQNLQVQAATNPTNTAPVQAAASTLPTPAAAVPVAGLAVEIAKQADAGNSHFAIRLDPPSLGRIDVHLDVDKSGNITTHVVADRQDTLDLLRRDQTQLERSLQDAGLKTGDNSMQFSLRDQSFAGRDDNSNSQSTTRLVVPDDNAAPVEAVRQNYGRLLGQGGGLDIRV